MYPPPVLIDLDYLQYCPSTTTRERSGWWQWLTHLAPPQTRMIYCSARPHACTSAFNTNAVLLILFFFFLAAMFSLHHVIKNDGFRDNKRSHRFFTQKQLYTRCTTRHMDPCINGVHCEYLPTDPFHRLRLEYGFLVWARDDPRVYPSPDDGTTQLILKYPRGAQPFWNIDNNTHRDKHFLLKKLLGAIWERYILRESGKRCLLLDLHCYKISELPWSTSKREKSAVWTGKK